MNDPAHVIKSCHDDPLRRYVPQRNYKGPNEYDVKANMILMRCWVNGRGCVIIGLPELVLNKKRPGDLVFSGLFILEVSFVARPRINSDLIVTF